MVKHRVRLKMLLCCEVKYSDFLDSKIGHSLTQEKERKQNEGGVFLIKKRIIVFFSKTTPVVD